MIIAIGIGGRSDVAVSFERAGQALPHSHGRVLSIKRDFGATSFGEKTLAHDVDICSQRCTI
jgi:hypothetical protein